MSPSSPERVRDSAPVRNSWMYLVEKYQLLEKGVVSQEELDHLLDSPMRYQLDDEALVTLLKIVQPEDPALTLDDLEEMNKDEEPKPAPST